LFRQHGGSERKKVLLGVLVAVLMAPLAGCIVNERDDGYSYRRPYPYRPYPYRYSYPYRYGYYGSRFDYKELHLIPKYVIYKRSTVKF
jgi:hypothetical protein